MKFNIRLKCWMLATSAVLVLVLIGLFLTTVFGKFSTVAEENAKERFTLVTQRAAAEISTLLGGMSHSVATLSNSAPGAFIQSGKINQSDLIPHIYGVTCQ